MGKNNWFGVVKRVFSPEPKEKKAAEQKSPKSKKKWGFCKSKPVASPTVPAPEVSNVPEVDPSPPPPPAAPVAGVKLIDPKQEPNKDVYSAAIATAEAAAVAAKAAAEVVRLTASATMFSNKSKEEVAAIKIQTAFRAHLARRALRSLRGLVKLRSVMHGDAVQRQARNALQCMQTLTRVQLEICARRIRMTEENEALQLKCERELEATRTATGNLWDDSLLSKEKIEASIANKHEATIRRERALAYAFSHQWRSSSRTFTQWFTDPSNPQCGWSWMERWMAARPWGSRCVEKEPGNDQTHVNSVNLSGGGGTLKAYGQRDAGGGERSSPMAKKSGGRQSPSTPQSKASSVTGGRIRSASPRVGYYPSEDDTRSLFSIRSERNRLSSIARSSTRDDESLASSPAIPNYMATTESARAKSRVPSPSSAKIMLSNVSSAKKRLSFPVPAKPGMVSPTGARRHSGPPKIDASSVKDVHSQSELMAGNGSRR